MTCLRRQLLVVLALISQTLYATSSEIEQNSCTPLAINQSNTYNQLQFPNNTYIDSGFSNPNPQNNIFFLNGYHEPVNLSPNLLGKSEKNISNLMVQEIPAAKYTAELKQSIFHPINEGRLFNGKDCKLIKINDDQLEICDKTKDRIKDAGCYFRLSALIADGWRYNDFKASIIDSSMVKSVLKVIVSNTNEDNAEQTKTPAHFVQLWKQFCQINATFVRFFHDLHDDWRMAKHARHCVFKFLNCITYGQCFEDSFYGVVGNFLQALMLRHALSSSEIICIDNQLRLRSINLQAPNICNFNNLAVPFATFIKNTVVRLENTIVEWVNNLLITIQNIVEKANQSVDFNQGDQAKANLSSLKMVLLKIVENIFDNPIWGKLNWNISEENNNTTWATSGQYIRGRLMALIRNIVSRLDPFKYNPNFSLPIPKDFILLNGQHSTDIIGNNLLIPFLANTFNPIFTLQDNNNYGNVQITGNIPNEMLIRNPQNTEFLCAPNNNFNQINTQTNENVFSKTLNDKKPNTDKILDSSANVFNIGAESNDVINSMIGNKRKCDRNNKTADEKIKKSKKGIKKKLEQKDINNCKYFNGNNSNKITKHRKKNRKFRKLIEKNSIELDEKRSNNLEEYTRKAINQVDDREKFFENLNKSFDSSNDLEESSENFFCKNIKDKKTLNEGVSEKTKN